MLQNYVSVWILAKGGECKWKVLYLKDKILEDAKKIRCGPLHDSSRVKFQETEKRKVSFMDLITLPKRLQPTGLHGEVQFEGTEAVPRQGRGWGQGCRHGRGRGRGGQLPNQLLTSHETMAFIKNAAAKQSQKEKKVEEKQEFVKVALKQKAKRDRLVKKMEKAGEL